MLIVAVFTPGTAAIGKQKAVPFWVILVVLQENAPLRSKMYVSSFAIHFPFIAIPIAVE